MLRVPPPAGSRLGPSLLPQGRAVEASAKVAKRVVVTGQVQGVFFRDACRRRAQESEVSGWVRNRSDGAVEAWFEGSPKAVEGMVDWCRDGPRRAAVETVRVEAVDLAEIEGFGIR